MSAPPPLLNFDDAAATVARALIGAHLRIDGVGGRIVETEAYDVDDAASHSHVGLRPRHASPFGPAGRAYVYQSYGIHWCLNLVCRGEGQGAGVLIRALQPAWEMERMAERRGTADPHLLCAGPGRLGQALGIGPQHDGLPLDQPPFELQPAAAAHEVVVGAPIGISRARQLPWRFGLLGSPFLSRRFP